MTQQLTEAEAVEIVAPRAGLSTNGGLWFNASGKVVFGDELLNSRDALQPVLEKMTAEETIRFNDLLLGEWERARARYLDVNQHPPMFTHWLLTLPARTLCLAVAAAIKESAK